MTVFYGYERPDGSVGVTASVMEKQSWTSAMLISLRGSVIPASL